MEILKKKDYDTCEMYGFKLNQKVFFKKKNKKSKILAIDTLVGDSFVFFVRDEEGNYCSDVAGYRGVKKVFDKKGTWCKKEEISPITKPVVEESIHFVIKECMKKELSLCIEEDEEKHKYFRYIDRVFFVKSADDSELGFSDDNKLVEVEKEKDAEAIVIRLNNVSAEIEYFLRTLMFLNPENHSSILECVISARMGSISSSTDDLLDLLVDSELILDYWGEYYKAVLIKI